MAMNKYNHLLIYLAGFIAGWGFAHIDWPQAKQHPIPMLIGFSVGIVLSAALIIYRRRTAR